MVHHRGHSAAYAVPGDRSSVERRDRCFPHNVVQEQRNFLLIAYVTFESCMWSITQNERWPGNEARSKRVIHSETASSASMLGKPMHMLTRY